MLGTMDVLHVILALGLIALAGLAVWLLLGRGELMARVGAAEQAKAGAEQREKGLADRLAKISEEAARLGESVRALTGEVGEFRARCEQIERERESDRDELTKHYEQRLIDLGLSHEEQLAHQRVVLGERETHLHKREAEVRAMLEDFKRQEGERQTQLKAAFGAMAAEVARSNSQEFLKLAGERLSAAQQQGQAELEKRALAVEQMVRPIAETLKRTDEKLAAIEQQRASGEATMKAQMEALSRTNVELRGETGKLVKALREPQVRGRYGEIQLKRVAELAGMRSYCDFAEQSQTIGDDGRPKRPDMIIRLPNGRELVVDAKANLKPYIDAMEAATPDEADALLKRFADGVADQAQKLSRKGYYAEYDRSPEFVVMFVPGDQFVDAALAKRPDLLEFAASNNVILASPSSLIAMLRAVAVGFREANLAAEAEELFKLGRTLHERAAMAMEHVASLGRALDQATRHFNGFLGSYETRLLPTLQRFEAAGVKGAKELPELPQITVKARELPGLLFAPDLEEGG